MPFLSITAVQESPAPRARMDQMLKFKGLRLGTKVSAQWWDMAMEELVLQESRGINMEIVALRDIKHGEEVFIDYGPEWEAAWENHVASWTPPQRSKRYMPASIANRIPLRALKQFLSYDLRKSKEPPKPFHSVYLQGFDVRCRGYYWRRSQLVEEIE
jgi:hypothetical protein